ncbi:hypothetical protein [Nonomuraea typhae]|uniref:TetR/AcrR family transcriptional regulator n=1 Tax=Nonomuraea typhae TaxID=2603600 RepID=A0ABW7YWJ2_9ACTN
MPHPTSSELAHAARSPHRHDLGGCNYRQAHWHFGFKEGLIAEVVDQAFTEAERAYWRGLAEAGELSFDVLMDAHLSIINARCGRIVATTLPEVMQSNGPVREAFVRGYERNLGHWVGWIRELTADPAPERLAGALFGSVLGLNVMRMFDERIDVEGGLIALGELLLRGAAV